MLSEVRETIKPFLSAMREQEAARRVAEGLRIQARISRISATDEKRLASERRTG
jgi:hypothetical protein